MVTANEVLKQDRMMTVRHLPHCDSAVPINAVLCRDAQGLYLNRAKQDIHDLMLGG